MLNFIPKTCHFRIEGNVKCNSNEKVSVFIIFNPVTFTYEVSACCQKHSDLVIGKFINEYKTISQDIKRKEEERRNKTVQGSTGYEITFNKTLNDDIKELRSKRELIGNHQCRGINEKHQVCNTKIFKGSNRYVIDCFHNNGSERHYFYFCSIECLNSFRASLGLIEPQIITLANFSK